MMIARTLLALCAVSLALGSVEDVKTESGLLKGAVKGNVVSCKGIPFAAPPVGVNRWRPPQPVTPWKEVRAATEFGADCMQKPFPGDAAPLGVTPKEDCLYVNVWSPANRSAQLPVMVWIYGGGFVNGGSSPAVYDGSQFAENGVVLVSFNYRLGRFGFFAHPALTEAEGSGPLGNYAFMDQIAVLRWVQKNITSFGGDPGNVTIFGESAGGHSVLTLMTSPAVKGLFNKAIVESGGGRSSLIPARRLHESRPGAPSAEEVGVAFAEKAGIKGMDAAALAALRALPAEAVVDGMNMMTMNNPTYAGPMIDGKIVTESVQEALMAGRQAKVPLIIGSNGLEFPFSFAKTIDDLMAPFGSDRAKAEAAYDPENTKNLQAVGAVMGSDAAFVEPARFVVRQMQAARLRAYEYRFAYVAESMRKQWKAAPHATEIPYVFNTVAARYEKDLAASDEAVAKAANLYWVNFAKNGDPNGAGLPEWPAYTADNDTLMAFSPTGPAAKTDPWKARLDLTAKVAEQKH
jgi:para-nitrobenzyl esterase